MPLEGEYEPSASTWVRDHVALYEGSGGTMGTTLHDMGRPGTSGRSEPVVLLTSLGARSGRVRKTPVMRVEHDGRYAVVASIGGSPKHPTWYVNLKAHPHVQLQDGPVKQDLTAREVDGEERALWWARAVAAFPDYAGYAAKTERVIPVFVLDGLPPQSQ